MLQGPITELKTKQVVGKEKPRKLHNSQSQMINIKQNPIRIDQDHTQKTTF